MDLYKFAAQHALRFPSNRGMLTVEQLFQLPLRSKSGGDLDTIARTINKELREKTEESFIPSAEDDPIKKNLEIALDIVKDVIQTKVTEDANRVKRLKKAEERKKILDAISMKQNQALNEASLQDLERRLAALED